LVSPLRRPRVPSRRVSPRRHRPSVRAKLCKKPSGLPNTAGPVWPSYHPSMHATVKGQLPQILHAPPSFRPSRARHHAQPRVQRSTQQMLTTPFSVPRGHRLDHLLRQGRSGKLHLAPSNSHEGGWLPRHRRSV